MHFTKFLTLVGFLATAAIAAPNAEPNPPKPTKPSPSPSAPAQQNACGNGAQPYCCNTDSKGAYNSCYAFRTFSAFPTTGSPPLGASLLDPVQPLVANDYNTTEFSSQCSQTTVCCNAQNSVQVCIGNAEITKSPYY
ncbi:MAG: hypothetical protein Q9224_002071 [Gallowayella concinna]